MEIQTIEKIIETCSQQDLTSGNLFNPNLSVSTNAEIVSECLNKELSAFGFQTYVTPDRTAVYIDDQNMSRVVDYVRNNGFQPIITTEHTERVKTIIDYAKDKKVDLLWSQVGIRRSYYYAKQYGFNGANLYNLLQINTANTALTATSGSAVFTVGGLVALSWSGSLFLATVDNYIPASFTKTKTCVRVLKVIIGVPTSCVEWTSNAIFGAVESIVFGHGLPTNVTAEFKLNIGPKLEHLKELKEPGRKVLEFLINRKK
jgi:hypothetical protein